MGQGHADSQPGLPFHQVPLGSKPTPLVSALQKGLALCKLHFPGSSVSHSQWEVQVGEEHVEGEEKLFSGFQLRSAASSSLWPPASCLFCYFLLISIPHSVPSSSLSVCPWQSVQALPRFKHQPHPLL